MASFFDDVAPPPQPLKSKQRFDVELLRRMGCKACPLAQLPNKNPDMLASGSKKPDVYILGEFPGEAEDKKDDHFVGAGGELLRARIPREWKDKVRFNNVVRTRPRGEPSEVAVECCRPSVVEDIERAQPLAIFGFGRMPLSWVMGGGTLQGIPMWRGRKMPVKVGTHTCWYYPMLDPTEVLHARRKDARDSGALAVGSEDERMFALDLKNAFAEVYDLPEPRVHTPAEVYANIELITDYSDNGVVKLKEWLDRAMAWPHVGFDYETNRLRPYSRQARILTFSFARAEDGFACPVEHPDAEWTDDQLNEIEGLLIEFLCTYKGRIYVHNLAFELEWSGVKLDRKLVRSADWHDTQTQAAVIDERKGDHKPGCFSLEFLIFQYFGFNIKKLAGVDRKNLEEVPVEIVLRYNGGDARYHDLLGIEQKAIIEQLDLEQVYVDSLRRVPTIVLSQMKGVPVDHDETARLQDKYQGRIEAAVSKIMALPVVKEFARLKGHAYNPRSNDDLLYVLVDMLKREECVVYDKKKKADRKGADADVLGKIDHPIAGLTLELREASKQLSVYIDPLDPDPPERVDPDGKVRRADSVIHDDMQIHATFNTVFARTGRLSCEEPNLQNFPKRDGEAKEVRKQVKAPPGHVILTVDYGQIEARVIAMFTKDPVFVKALWEDFDVHMEWAERIAYAYPKRIGGKSNLQGFKILEKDPKSKSEEAKACKDFRTDIKNQWTFPLFFGASLQSAANYLSIPIDDLEPEYNKFWKVFSTTKDWQEDELAFYRKHGYVECLTKRRRHGPLSSNQVYNSPVQGTAADIVMWAMCKLSEFGDPELQPEINIHDDLTYCRIPIDRVDTVAEKIIDTMLFPEFDFINVPIAVEAGLGENWLEIEEFGKFFSNKWTRLGA